MARTIEQDKFWGQRAHAKERGIRFLFTFEEWCWWWEFHLGPNWLQFRGGCRGKYVMARKMDKGNYEWDNVECLLHEDNCRAQAANGLSGAKMGSRHTKPSPHKGRPSTRRGKGTKINGADAIRILCSKQKQKDIALQYGISDRLVRLIKNKKVWVDVLKDIYP